MNLKFALLEILGLISSVDRGETNNLTIVWVLAVFISYTVDGRNPAPAGMFKSL